MEIPETCEFQLSRREKLLSQAKVIGITAVDAVIMRKNRVSHELLVLWCSDVLKPHMYET